MTSEEIIEYFNDDDNDDEFLKFERISEEDRLHSNSDLCGLLKVASLTDDGMSITEEDIIYLLRCGIHYENSRECLVLYC